MTIEGQLSILDDPPPQPSEPQARHDGPDTSHAAAASLSLEHLSGVEAAIVDAFSTGIGMTDDELCEHLPEHYAPTVKTARSRLAKRGALIDTGQRRPSQRGREQIVWAAAPCQRCGCPVPDHNGSMRCRSCGTECGLSCGRVRVPGIGLVSVVALEEVEP